jgi:uncharacterized protein (DUF2252 family)
MASTVSSNAVPTTMTPPAVTTNGRTTRPRRAVPHPTVAEREATGRAARKAVPRSSHAELADAPADRDPVELLERQAAARVPELLPIRYGRMLVSPFTFYRGAAAIMADDLSRVPSSGLEVQLCGDAHLLNFGVFGSAERRMMFDINDFDETAPGPFEWDVKRLAASVAIAGRDNGFSESQRRAAVLAVGSEYRTAMIRFATMTNLEVWYSMLDMDVLLERLRPVVRSKTMKKAEANIAKARTKDSHQAYDKLTHLVDGQPRIISDPPLILSLSDVDDADERDAVMALIHEIFVRYRRTLQKDRRQLLEQFRIVDVARKVVGVGSVGTRAWIVLLLGRDGNDPLFLQAKEALPSVLEPYHHSRRRISNGERVVTGQRLMQASSDIFLGWDSPVGIDGVRRDYYFRQLRDWKGSAQVETLEPRALEIYSRICAHTLARAHARSGDRVAIASYLGAGDRFDTAIVEFAEVYADQNERDHAALAAAEASGRVVTQRDV